MRRRTVGSHFNQHWSGECSKFRVHVDFVLHNAYIIYNRLGLFERSHLIYEVPKTHEVEQVLEDVVEWFLQEFGVEGPCGAAGEHVCLAVSHWSYWFKDSGRWNAGGVKNLQPARGKNFCGTRCQLINDSCLSPWCASLLPEERPTGKLHQRV